MKINILIGVLLVLPLTGLAAVTITGNNNQAVQDYRAKLSLAKQYLADIKAEVKKADALKFSGNPNMHKLRTQSFKFNLLRSEGESKFGNTIFSEPFGRCGVLGATVQFLWDGSLNNLDKINSDDAYISGLKGCESQIKNKPEETLSITADGSKSPFLGCLRIIKVSPDGVVDDATTSWTCPKKNVKIKP